MRLFGWLNRRGAGPAEAGLGEWRKAWQAAATRGSVTKAEVEALRSQLEAHGHPEEEIEIEREMLEGLERLTEVESTAASGLPVVPTGHRVVGRDPCHFSAPVSMPDDPAQPSGRLLLTSTRAIFVGGGSGSGIPWHTVAEVAQTGRDVVLLRKTGDRLHRFRCNSYGDALVAALLARRLTNRRT